MKDERRKLFKTGKPEFRFMELEDIKWLWASYKINGGEMGQDEFTEFVTSRLAPFHQVYIAEDVNPRFDDHKGPVALITVNTDGWGIEPHVEFFPWATVRNKVKVIIGFLMQKRFSPDVGCIMLRVSEEFRELFQRLDKYAPIRVCGKIAGGRPEGADYIFYVRGKRK